MTAADHQPDPTENIYGTPRRTGGGTGFCGNVRFHEMNYPGVNSGGINT